MHRAFLFKSTESGAYEVSAGDVVFGTVAKVGQTWFIRKGNGAQIAGGRTRQEAADLLARLVETRPKLEKADPAPASKSSTEDRRRRLEADIEDARNALIRARTRFEGLCDELAALRREEREF